MKLATRTFRKDRGTGSNQYYVTSPFGWRKDPISGEYKGHNGCDYGTHGNKWPQYCLENGTVENVYKDYYGAICVRIAYPRLGYRLTHAHLNSATVKTGQSVNKNTILGYTGTTGYSTGIHLHLGVQKIGDSKWIDPESIDYQEGPTPPPTPGPYPYDAVIKKGSPLYTANGERYPNGTSADRNITVQGELNGRYQIWGKTFNPHVVYCDKSSIKGSQPTPKYPFNGIIKKGSPLYNKYGARYQNGTSADRNVEVRGEYNGRYEVYGSTFTPHIVYCDKSSLK